MVTSMWLGQDGVVVTAHSHNLILGSESPIPNQLLSICKISRRNF